MNSDDRKINIVKILNLPIENDEVADVDISFEFDNNINAHRIFDKNIENSEVIWELVKHKKIKPYEKYKCEYLFVVDEHGNKYTLYGFSYVLKYYHFEFYIDFSFNALLLYEHFENLKNMIVKQVEFEVEYSKAIQLDFTYDNVHIISEPQYELTPEILEWMGADFEGIFTKRIKFTFKGKQSFGELETVIWGLSEFVFLCYEDMFFYDRLNVCVGEDSYVIKCFNRANNGESRKKSLYTKRINTKSNDFCNKALDGKNFSNFMTFRKKSGIVFDVFRTTIYSDSFREDYPLRLSQTMEGLANYLEIADTEINRQDTFRSAIELSLHCNDFIDEYLPTFRSIKDFSKEITAHRNKFSHVKIKGDYLHGEKNEHYAEILYTTIRILIVKDILGLI